MKCPVCSFDDTQVKDSRPSEDGLAIRRRRQCPSCESRFTTFERVQLREVVVVKKNGDRRPFDRDKIARSIILATRKRFIPVEKIEKAVDSVAQKLENQLEGEISTNVIGELVMTELKKLDTVAYVRFASVYRDFTETADFEKFIGGLNKKSRR